MDKYKKSLFKIAILNDLLDLELTEINIKNILNPEINSKLRNLKKSTKNISNMTDLIFSESDIQEIFGDLSDKINLVINNEINNILD